VEEFLAITVGFFIDSEILLAEKKEKRLYTNDKLMLSFYYLNNCNVLVRNLLNTLKLFAFKDYCRIH
jgi:hypothetical protein